jgi:outer membrane murein-binding lipoprotein Lpp
VTEAHVEVEKEDPPPKAGPPKRRSLSPRRRVFLVLGGLVVLLVLVAVFGIWRASRAGTAGRVRLVRAQRDLLDQKVNATRQDLQAADRDFRQMHDELHSFPFGPVLAFWRAVPLVRVQVRAVDAFADIGVSLSQTGLKITDAAAVIDQPTGPAVPLSDSLDKLRTVQTALRDGVTALETATTQLKALGGYRLLGPLAGAHRDATTRIAKIDATARSAMDGVNAMIAFTGGDGHRSYLILSQNPDELRPTGGFMGSYGVLAADAGKVRLTRYDDSVAWVRDHPTAVIPADQVGSPFRFYDPPLEETFANTNTTPDWPHAAEVALKLWAAAGEAPTDGVVSFTPQFLARILAVTGPVVVPGYNETVTAGNVVGRLDYYTHVLPPTTPGLDRKEFLSPLGQAVMAKLLQAPASQWRSLGAAVSKAFAARQLLVWSHDQTVQSTLVQRGWDGVLPATDGDFFYDGEFEYAAKNGRGLKRTFDEQVSLHADGSARVTTTLTINNTEAPSPVNNDVLTYYTLYGPAGAVLDPVASDPPFSLEPALGGHPAAGWFRTVAPNSTGTIKVVWDVPGLGQRRSDGSWQYALNFQHIVDNTGDVLDLKVDLPAGAHWDGKAPLTHANLDKDITGTWIYRLKA